MPGMLAGPVRERQQFVNLSFVSGWSNYNSSNDAADQIIEAPDRFLLNQEELFGATGGWSTFALTMGLGAAGAIGVLVARPSMAAHMGRGQLKAYEWGLLGASAYAGGCLGNQLGVRSFGDSVRYNNHWMAYTWVKA